MKSYLDFDVLAKDNIRTLKLPTTVFRRPAVFILVGLPVSGKTTLVHKLTDKFPLTILSEEDMSAFLSPGATIFQRNSTEIFQLALKTIEFLVKMGKACIYDANVKTREQRKLIRQVVEEAGGTYALIYLNCSKEECYKRLRKHNLAVERGEAKGFILDRDLFEFEVSSTDLPTTEEAHLGYNSEDPESIYQLFPQVEKIINVK